ncbi:MAG TPA: glycosyltransferase [Gaiellaceae bacterium]|jgi:glycosyltransferase involved in cell wall biosynthesis|nr:glycosyltransferase [Gaiellaceae bacterium]
MSRPLVVVLRGHSANPWDLRPWERLTDRFDVRVLVTGSNAFDVSGVALPVERVRAVRDRLPRGRVGDLAALGIGDRYLGLEEALRGAEIVHAAEIGVPFSHGPALLRDRLGFKLVLTVWETIPFGSAYRAFRSRRQRRETIPQVDLFLAATERARRMLLLEGAPDERIEVAPPGIDTARFRVTEPPADHLVLSVGRLVWEKGHQDLLRALAWLRRDGVEARALIVGAGPEEARLRSHTDELGLADRVELVTSVPYDEMPAVFGRGSCFVLASLPTRWWEEQFGMVLAEAAASGLPIVAAESGAIPEVLQGHGSLFPPGDWQLLAERLRPVLAAPPRRVEPGELGVRYSVESAAERYAAAYERLLSSP